MVREPSANATIALAPSGAFGTYRRWGKCSSCGKEAFWCTTKRGNPVSFDQRPSVLHQDADGSEIVRNQHVHLDSCPKRRTSSPSSSGASDCASGEAADTEAW